MRELREGDQPYPTGNFHPHTHDLAREALAGRKLVGIERYGQPLQPANGRDFARDAYEEALDCAAYLAGLVWEQNHPEETYVGRLLAAVVSGGSLPDFDGVFVPQAVVDYLDKVGM